MSTILYPSPIVGPIHSRRLGISLGVNVNPSDGKYVRSTVYTAKWATIATATPHRHALHAST